MTNRKIKDYYRNKETSDRIKKNMELQCEILLACHNLFPKVFYKSACQDWLEDLKQTSDMGFEWENEGTLFYKLEKRSEVCGIDTKLVSKFVMDRLEGETNPTVTNDKAIGCFKVNTLMALVMTAEDFRIGRERMKRLQHYLCDNRIENSIGEVNRLGIAELIPEEPQELDFRETKRKKMKLSLAEIKEASEGLEAFRTWSEANVQKG